MDPTRCHDGGCRPDRAEDIRTHSGGKGGHRRDGTASVSPGRSVDRSRRDGRGGSRYHSEKQLAEGIAPSADLPDLTLYRQRIAAPANGAAPHEGGSVG